VWSARWFRANLEEELHLELLPRRVPLPQGRQLRHKLGVGGETRREDAPGDLLSGLWVRFSGFGFGVQGLECGVQGLGLRVWG